MPQRLRIFLSSAADVFNERLRAELIIDKLSKEYSYFFNLESYRWEHEALLASKHFQDTIETPSLFDIVVLILWSRLGTPLPERTNKREYRGIDGRAPVTGIEWEYEEALKAARERGAPDLLAFRNVSPAPIDPHEPDITQLKALNEFWRRHFKNRGLFLSAYDEYQTLEEFASRIEQSLRKLIERRIKALTTSELHTEPIWLGDPFRGLQSYEFEHAAIFFGRDAAVMKATEQLVANARGGQAFLLVSGMSGSGKSSLVKAGLLPRLMKAQRVSGVSFLRRIVFRPGSEDQDVILGLARTLTRAGGPDVGLPELIAPGQNEMQLAMHLRGAAAETSYLFANALGQLTEAGRKSGRLLAFEEAKLVLVIDQLEELFTAPSITPTDRQLFVRIIAGLARSGVVWIVATLRADFWHRAAEIPEFTDLTEGLGRIDLAPPSAAELAEIIRKPAQAAGLLFEAHVESGLGLDAVLAEHAAAAPGALPLLSFTLDELHKSAQNRREVVLTHSSYQMLGGLEGAIANRADDVVASLPAAAQAALPWVLRALTTVNEPIDQPPTARSAPLAKFGESGPGRTLVDALIAARLLVAGTEDGTVATVRLAHEALISRWERARAQLSADRRDLETRTHVERQFARWAQAHGVNRRRFLLRNPDLTNAVDLAKRWGEELEGSLREFIKQSNLRARLVQTLVGMAAILFAAVAAAAIYAERLAVRERESAVRSARETTAAKARSEQNLNQALLAQSRFLATHSDQQLKSGDASAAVLFALEALLPNNKIEKRPYTKEADLALSNALQYLREIALFASPGPISSVNFSVDGDKILVTSEDGKAWIVNASLSKAITTLKGHQEAVLAGAFSPDGRFAVTGSKEGAARIWNVKTGTVVHLLEGHHGPVTSVAFDPGGRRVVTASEDGSVRIWDVTTGANVATLEGHSGPVSHATFSPDGRQVVTGSFDYTARVWDVATRRAVMFLEGHGGPVNSVTFSPDGRLIATGSADKTVRVWSVETGKVVLVLDGHAGSVQSAQFDNQGRRIVSASTDGLVRIWDVESGARIGVLKGHRKGLRDAAFSPDGQQVVTASDDHTARLWNIETATMVPVLKGHSRAVFSAVFSPNGKWVATASGDGTARIWNPEVGETMVVLRDPAGPTLSAAFSPDGRLLLTSSYSGAARIWDLKTKKNIVTLEGHTGPVFSAVFSPDGRQIVTASTDRTARVWDATTGKTMITLRPDIDDRLYRAAFSPDGKRVVAASESGTAYIWDINTGQMILALKGHNGPLFCAEFSSDGQRLVTASGDTTARIWDAATGNTLSIMRAHTGPIMSATFSFDGRFVLTASWDGTARLWDAQTGSPIASLADHSQAVFSAAFSPDARRIVTASRDKTARIYDVQKLTAPAHTYGNDTLIDRAKKLVPRCLEPAERVAAFLEAGPPAWCIELGKWPYDSNSWKDWLAYTRIGLDPPYPGTPGWENWRGTH